MWLLAAPPKSMHTRWIPRRKIRARRFHATRTFKDALPDESHVAAVTSLRRARPTGAFQDFQNLLAPHRVGRAHVLQRIHRLRPSQRRGKGSRVDVADPLRD